MIYYGGHGYIIGMPPPRLFGGFSGPFEKWWPTDCCTQQFSLGLLLWIKIRHLKGENKWESSGRFHENRLDIEGLRAAPSNEIVVPGQNIALSAKRRHLRMPATDI